MLEDSHISLGKRFVARHFQRMLYQIIWISKITKFELFQSLSFGSSACAVSKCLLTVDLNEF